MRRLIPMAVPDAAIISREVADILVAARIDAARRSKLRDEDFKLWTHCHFAYCFLQCKFALEEDYESSKEWIVGEIRADLSEVREVIENELEDCDFEEVWDVLTSNGVVEVVGDTIRLPMLILKVDLVEELRKQLEWLQRKAKEREKPKKEGPADATS